MTTRKSVRLLAAATVISGAALLPASAQQTRSRAAWPAHATGP